MFGTGDQRLNKEKERNQWMYSREHKLYYVLETNCVDIGEDAQSE